MLELVLELGHEFGIGSVVKIAFAELVERMDQRFRDEYAAVRPEMAALVGKAIVHLHRAPAE